MGSRWDGDENEKAKISRYDKVRVKVVAGRLLLIGRYKSCFGAHFRPKPPIISAHYIRRLVECAGAPRRNREGQEGGLSSSIQLDQRTNHRIRSSSIGPRSMSPNRVHQRRPPVHQQDPLIQAITIETPTRIHYHVYVLKTASRDPECSNHSTIIQVIQVHSTIIQRCHLMNQ
eukprot:scaffold118701_cov23-Cyclotella_meneghiniana.AAC.1